MISQLDPNRMNKQEFYRTYRCDTDNKIAKQKATKILLNNCERILDVGCGKILHNFLNKKIISFDLFHGHIRADMHFIPFKNNSFDGVIARHVLEHTEKEAQLIVLKEIFRVLDKGIVFIAIPDKERWDSEKSTAHHQYVATDFEIFEWIGECGFNLVASYQEEYSYFTERIFILGKKVIHWVHPQIS